MVKNEFQHKKKKTKINETYTRNDSTFDELQRSLSGRYSANYTAVAERLTVTFSKLQIDFYSL